MPIYTFENPKTGEIKEVVQKMSESHIYVDESGMEWKRVWHPTNFSIDGTVNPFSFNDFEKTAQGKNYTLGEMWERSAEMSEKRIEKEGKDSVKEKWLKDYSKSRKGTKYTEDGNLIGGGSGDVNVSIEE